MLSSQEAPVHRRHLTAPAKGTRQASTFIAFRNVNAKAATPTHRQKSACVHVGHRDVERVVNLAQTCKRGCIRPAVGLRRCAYALSRPATRTLQWTIEVLREAGAIRQCEERGWMQDRAGPHARERAVTMLVSRSGSHRSTRSPKSTTYRTRSATPVRSARPSPSLQPLGHAVTRHPIASSPFPTGRFRLEILSQEPAATIHSNRARPSNSTPTACRV